MSIHCILYRSVAQVEGGSVHTFAVNVAWDRNSEHGEGASSLPEAIVHVQRLLRFIAEVAPADAASVPKVQTAAEKSLPDRRSWDNLLNMCLQSLHAEAETCIDDKACGKGCDEPCLRLDDVTEQALKVKGLEQYQQAIGCICLLCRACTITPE
jgi:hypothetical protein